LFYELASDCKSMSGLSPQ